MKSVHDDRRLIGQLGKDPLGLLGVLDGYYECPKDAAGKRLGPLVGYAGRYGEQNLQFVGDVYANFAAAEEEPFAFAHMVELLRLKLLGETSSDVAVTTFCAMPMGGITFAYELAKVFDGRFVFPEKKVTALATPTSREQSQLVFARHRLEAGEQVVICEDVLNNFSTTDDGIRLIEASGAEVVAIVGLLNRSLKVDATYAYNSGRHIPVFSLVRKPIVEYMQHDPAVAADVAAGNVAWKPKSQWALLKKAMGK